MSRSCARDGSAGRVRRRVEYGCRTVRGNGARGSSSAPTDCARSSPSGSGLAHSLRWPRRLALVTHYRDVRDVGEHGEMHVERDGYVGIADVGNGLTTVALVIPASRVARDLRADSRARFSTVAPLAPAPRARASRAPTHATPVVATGPFASHARRALAPGAALVGDAADFFDPFTGEGIYAALRGGEMLADRAREALNAPTHARPMQRARAVRRARGAGSSAASGSWSA